MEKISVRLKIKFVVFAILSLIFFACANQQAPPGGPKDSTPPEITYIYPENGSLNFTDSYFQIDFSEYVEKLSLLDAFFVSPEIKNLEYNWSGTSVTITFDDTLKAQTTYTISIGSGIKDLNNQNPMLNAKNVSFSTGDKIDVGNISGKIFDKEINGTMIFAYQNTDSLSNPIMVKAENITQVGEDGIYNLLGLKNGEYRIFAVKDINGNRKYNIGDDLFGVTSQNIILSDSSNSLTGINFKLTREDTLAPFISNVSMTDQYHLVVEYSEALDSSKIDSQNFWVIDSVANKKINVKYLYQGNKRKFEYILVLSDTLNNDDNYLVANNIIDKYSNKNDYEVYGFVNSSKLDTLAPDLKSISTPFADKMIDYLYPEFTINFSDGITESTLVKSLEFDKINFSVKKENDAVFKILLNKQIEAKQTISFKINRKLLFDSAGNNVDSIQTIELNTLSGREFTGLSGKVITDQNDLIVIIMNVENPDLNYSVKVDDDFSYSFERILPGKYILWVFQDRDLNNKYSYGKILPFQLSESFVYSKDTLNLRARWPVGDVNITFNN